MKGFLIKCVNCALLILIVIAIPAITHVEYYGVLLGSGSKFQLLTFWTLTLALCLNVFAALLLFKTRKERLLCWEWVAAYGVLLFAYSALVFGYIHFDWLKNFLLRLESYL